MRIATAMIGVEYGTALFGVSNVMKNQLRGAITNGIVPEPESRTEPTSSPVSRNSLLTRAWRFATRPTARPKVACSTC
jgi:hypothetical protein